MATRSERVVLSLQDDFSSGMARAAAATALLNKQLNDLDGSTVGTNRSLADTAVQTDRVGASMRSNGAEIDRFSGRLRLFADLAAVLGPGLVPIGAVAVPAITALASQLGFAAIGAGSMVVAFQGVGDALKAVNDAALEPTAANLDKAREAMSKLGPEAQKFVTEFEQIRPVLGDIRDSAAAGWFPGLTESLDSLVEVGPRVGEILRAIGESGGGLLADAADSLAGPEWSEFLTFVQNNAPAALEELGRSIGNVASGLADLWVAFDPLNDDVSGWLLDASRDFAEWADGLSETQGFQDFIAYLRESGPLVGEALQSVGNALLQIVEAAAPLGGPVLQAITAVADALALIANSQAGPAILAAASAMALMSRASAGFAAVGKTAWATNISGARGLQVQAATLTKTLAGASAGIAAFAFAQSGLAEQTGLSQTAMGAMAGSLMGPYGAAVGTGIGFTLDLRAANDELTDSIERMGAAAESNNLNEINAALEAHLATRTKVSSQGSSFLDLGNFGAGIPGNLKAIITGDAEAVAELALGGEEAVWWMRELKKAASEVTLDNLGLGAVNVAAGMRSAADAIDEFSDSFRDLSGLLADRGTLRAYEEALDQLNASVKENGDSWDAAGAKGRANLEAMDTLVASAIERSDQLFANGRELAAQGMLTRALSDLREFRKENPKAADSLKPLFQELRRIHDQRVKPKLDLDTGAFKTAANGVDKALAGLNKRTAKPKVTLDAGNALGLISSIMGQLNAVDGRVATATVHINRTGSDISAPGVATGGHIRGPGTETSDSIPAMLSDNEFVVKAAAVRHYGPDFFHRANQMRLAGGGLVSQTYSSTHGIGNAASLNASGFASTLHDLTQIAAAEYDSRELQLDRTDKQFEKILERQLKRDQEQADADKSRLDAMKEMQKALEEQVSEIFKSDVFSKGESATYAVFPDGSRIAIEGGLENLSAQDAMYYQSSGAVYETDSGMNTIGGLETDVANLEEAMRLYQDLRSRGFDGPAFREMASKADVESLRYFASLSRQELAQIENLYDRREQLGTQVGQIAGGDFDRSIGRLERKYDQSLAQVKEQTREIRELKNEVRALKQQESRAPQLTGQAVGDALSGAMRDGITGRGRRG